MGDEGLDFSGVVNRLYDAVDKMPDGIFQDNNVLLIKLMSGIFDLDVLGAHSARCLEADFRSSAAYYIDLHAAPMPITRDMDISANYKRFRQDPQSASRGSKEYPLTEDETKKSHSVYSRATELQQTVAAMQYCLVTYISKLIDAHEEQKFTRPVIAYDRMSAVLDDARRSAMNFSMRHDLMPAIGLAIAQRGWKKGDALTADDFDEGLKLAFRKKAFRSIRETEEHEPELIKDQERQCPFAKVIGHWMSCAPVVQKDGHIAIDTEQNHKGALPAFIVDRIKYFSSREYIPELLYDI